MSQAGVLNFGGSSGTAVETLTGNSGGAVPPTSNNINVVGAGAVSVSGNPGTSTLTISISDGGFTWADKAVSFAAAANNGYMSTAAVTATLPATPANGDTIAFIASTADTLTIKASGTQVINIFLTTSSAGGTVTSGNPGFSATLVYQASSTTWFAVSALGTWGST